MALSRGHEAPARTTRKQGAEEGMGTGQSILRPPFGYLQASACDALRRAGADGSVVLFFFFSSPHFGGAESCGLPRLHIEKTPPTDTAIGLSHATGAENHLYCSFAQCAGAQGGMSLCRTVRRIFTSGDFGTGYIRSTTREGILSSIKDRSLTRTLHSRSTALFLLPGADWMLCHVAHPLCELPVC